MILDKRTDISPLRAKELLARFDRPQLIKTRGNRMLYKANGGSRHILWIAEPGGQVTLEVHDARCQC